jgi:alanyl-tRNA synthetase
VGLEKQIFSGIAAACAGKGDVLRFEEALDNTAVRDLADAVAEVCGGTAAVLSGEDGNFSVCLVNKTGDVKALGTAMNKALNGRGGGKPGYFQVSLKATRTQIEAFFAG